MSDQFIRGANIIVKRQVPGEVGFGQEVLVETQVGRVLSNADASDPELRITFRVSQQDVETPNNAVIRIYNLSPDTLREIRNEYDTVILQAGYRGGQVGTIFVGEIKQFRIGRENNVDSYLDLLAADGDVGYNFGVVAATLAAGQTLDDALTLAAESMNLQVDDKNRPVDLSGAIFVRGKVFMGMARDQLRSAARGIDATWSISEGVIQFIPLTDHLPGEAVVLNSKTGMIGIPELTPQGVNVRSLLNSSIRVGRLVKINNAEINQVIQRQGTIPTRFDSRKVPFIQPNTSADGTYRVLSVDHSGDTRGGEWYSDLVCLATFHDPNGNIKCRAYG